MQIRAHEQRTERDMLGLLRENFTLAAEACDRLAKGERGALYLDLRRYLREIEDLCRKLAHNRGDTRWLPVGIKVAESQQKVRQWLVGHAPGWKFERLAELMRLGMKKTAENLATKRTGRIGSILPVTLPGVHRETRPVAVPSNYEVRESGLIIPRRGG